MSHHYNHGSASSLIWIEFGNATQGTQTGCTTSIAVEYHLSMWNTAPGQQEFHLHRRKCNTRATAPILSLSLVVIHRPPLHHPSLNVKILSGVQILCCLRLKQKILCSAEAIKSLGTSGFLGKGEDGILISNAYFYW